MHLGHLVARMKIIFLSVLSNKIAVPDYFRIPGYRLTVEKKRKLRTGDCYRSSGFFSMFEDSGVVGGLAMIAIALLMNWEIRKSALLL